MVSIMRINGVEIWKKSKCAKQTAFLEKFQIAVNHIYTVCA